jgi:predicted nucleotidyltransferase
VIPALDPQTGALPVGRYPTTPAEFEQTFVTAPAYSGSTTRPEVWRHFQNALAILRTRTPVVAVWLGGSFTTDKADPDDLDVVFLIDSDDAAKIAGDRVLATFANNWVRQLLTFRLDTFVIDWRSIPDPNSMTLEDRDYYERRGHWDDFWQRRRTGPKTAVPVRADTLPARGYLEVSIDGYRP